MTAAMSRDGKVSQTALTNCRLIDGTGTMPRDGATILIAGERLAAVGGADLEVPADAAVVDVRGRAVLPGLIDGHMHVTSMPGLLDHLGHVRQNLQAVAKLQRCLEWGTTTVANTGGCPESMALKEVLDSGQVRGCARMLVGGMVNATGGHVRGRDADGPWEVRKAVREMSMAGVDYIKTAASGGFQWATEDIAHEDYTVEELGALTEESHSRGKAVHVHAHAQPGLEHAIDAGIDVILHGALIDEPALQGIAERDLWYMPTLYITSEAVYQHPSRPPHMKERMAAAHPVHRRGVARARELGLRVAGGTDGGPGSIWQEMAELVRCGYTPLEALTICTRNGADALGLAVDAGTVEAGRLADLVVVDGDPLADLAAGMAQERIAAVFLGGRAEVVRARELRERLGAL